MSVSEPVKRVDFAGIQSFATRDAGYAVALKCLEVQTAAEAITPGLRTDHSRTLHPDAVSWFTGAIGEIEVGKILALLGPEWFVRHAVPIGAGTKDVDHLVIGPAGVFAINTKYHSDKSIWVADSGLRVNNVYRRHLASAASDASDAATRLGAAASLPIPVTSVLAILDPRSIIDRRSPGNRSVAVLNARDLATWLHSHPRTLSPASLELAKLAAEEPGTWHIDPRAADTFRVMQRFERLRAEIGASPTVSPPTPRQPSTRARRPSTAVTSGNTNRRKTNAASAPTARSSTRTSSKGSDIAKLWTLVVVLFVVFGIADSIVLRACSDPNACVAASLVLLAQPLAVLAGVALVIGAAITTVRVALRSQRA